MDFGGSGEMWRDVGVRARMASAAPSMGLRHGHIGFRSICFKFWFKNVRDAFLEIVNRFSINV